jgi:hypothetical protein
MPSFLANYQMAAERYADLAKALEVLAKEKMFADPAYPKLKIATETARFECQQANEALGSTRKGTDSDARFGI